MQRNVNRFVLAVGSIELVALLPLLLDCLSNRWTVYLNHPSVSLFFYAGIGLMAIGAFAATRLRSHLLGLTVAAVCSAPIFILPLILPVVIASVPAF